MSIQYLQTSESLSQEDLRRSGRFSNSLSACPLTPYPKTPEIRDYSPSSLVTWDNLVRESESIPTSTPTCTPPTSSLCRSLPRVPLNISSTELQRALDSLLDQVNWLEVATDVAKNRAPFVYCNAIEKILLAHIYQLVKAENQDGKVS